MDIVSYHIFINLLVSHIKNIFVNYRQFALIFILVRTAILFLFFFNDIKIYEIIFFQQYVIKDYFHYKMDKKMEHFITKPTKKN